MLLLLLATVVSSEDRKKVEQLYYQYGKMMKQIAMRILQHEEDAEDAVYDAFVVILEKPERIDRVDSDRTRAFMAVIVRNIAANIARKKSRVLEIDARSCDLIEDERVDVQGEVQGRALYEALCALPMIYRDAMMLKMRYGMSSAEIGRVMDISASAAQKRVNRAKKMVMEKKDIRR